MLSHATPWVNEYIPWGHESVKYNTWDDGGIQTMNRFMSRNQGITPVNEMQWWGNEWVRESQPRYHAGRCLQQNPNNPQPEGSITKRCRSRGYHSITKRCRHSFFPNGGTKPKALPELFHWNFEVSFAKVIAPRIGMVSYLLCVWPNYKLVLPNNKPLEYSGWYTQQPAQIWCSQECMFPPYWRGVSWQTRFCIVIKTCLFEQDLLCLMICVFCWIQYRGIGWCANSFNECGHTFCYLEFAQKSNTPVYIQGHPGT